MTGEKEWRVVCGGKEMGWIVDRGSWEDSVVTVFMSLESHDSDSNKPTWSLRFVLLFSLFCKPNHDGRCAAVL